jgi:hypothetical protein
MIPGAVPADDDIDLAGVGRIPQMDRRQAALLGRGVLGRSVLGRLRGRDDAFQAGSGFGFRHAP